MVVGNPIRAIIGIISGLITAFVSDPRMTFLYTCIWAWMGLAAGLLGVGNDLHFFNIFTSFLFGVAAFLLLLTVIKSIVWLSRGLKESAVLPDGRIVMAFLHQGRPVTQAITPPTKKVDLVEVACPQCGDKFLVWVDNPQARKARQRYLALMALLMLLVGLALNIFLTSYFIGSYNGAWVFWVRFVGYIALFANAIYLSKLLQYARVRTSIPYSKDHPMVSLKPALLAKIGQQQTEIARAAGQ
jgi:hypothetical protein